MDKSKAIDAAVGLAVLGTVVLGPSIKVSFDPTKDLSLNSVSVSVEMPKASAACSDNKSGSGTGCVC
ncbi:hypothetical protein [Ancylobacter terrae]|uniref:hypothetical protein n=1 Tax=Ancylobacter sp. sgz301288 TaxID=3342077 RepID=UPI00385DE9B3